MAHPTPDFGPTPSPSHLDDLEDLDLQPPHAQHVDSNSVVSTPSNRFAQVPWHANPSRQSTYKPIIRRPSNPFLRSQSTDKPFTSSHDNSRAFHTSKSSHEMGGADGMDTAQTHDLPDQMREGNFGETPKGKFAFDSPLSSPEKPLRNSEGNPNQTSATRTSPSRSNSTTLSRQSSQFLDSPLSSPQRPSQLPSNTGLETPYPETPHTQTSPYTSRHLPDLSAARNADGSQNNAQEKEGKEGKEGRDGNDTDLTETTALEFDLLEMKELQETDERNARKELDNLDRLNLNVPERALFNDSDLSSTSAEGCCLAFIREWGISAAVFQLDFDENEWEEFLMRLLSGRQLSSAQQLMEKIQTQVNWKLKGIQDASAAYHQHGKIGLIYAHGCSVWGHPVLVIRARILSGLPPPAGILTIAHMLQVAKAELLQPNIVEQWVLLIDMSDVNPNSPDVSQALSFIDEYFTNFTAAVLFFMHNPTGCLPAELPPFLLPKCHLALTSSVTKVIPICVLEQRFGGETRNVEVFDKLYLYDLPPVLKISTYGQTIPSLNRLIVKQTPPFIPPQERYRTTPDPPSSTGGPYSSTRVCNNLAGSPQMSLSSNDSLYASSPSQPANSATANSTRLLTPDSSKQMSNLRTAHLNSLTPPSTPALQTSPNQSLYSQPALRHSYSHTSYGQTSRSQSGLGDCEKSDDSEPFVPPSSGSTDVRNSSPTELEMYQPAAKHFTRGSFSKGTFHRLLFGGGMYEKFECAALDAAAKAENDAGVAFDGTVFSTASERLRFLQACEWNETEFLSAALQHLEWRNSIFPLDFGAFSELQKVGFAYVYGRDRRHRPIIVCRGKHLRFGHQHQAFNLILHWIEYSIRQLCIPGKVEQLTVIIDLDGMSWINIASIGLQGFLQQLLNNYPGRLHKCFLTNMSFLFEAAWKLWFESSMPESCRASIVVAGKGEIAKAMLLKEISQSQLERNLGGKGANTSGQKMSYYMPTMNTRP